MSTPTAHQVRCWEALHEHRGAVPAAHALGIETANLRLAVKAYMRNMGIEGRAPFTAPYIRRKPTPEMLAQQAADAAIAERDATIARLTARIAELETLAHPWFAVHAKLDLLIARPSGTFQPDHRRVKDGGRTVKEQRRSLRPTG